MAQDGWAALGDLLSGNAGREARERGMQAGLQGQQLSARTQYALEQARNERSKANISEDTERNRLSLSDALVGGYGLTPEQSAAVAGMYRASGGNFDQLTGGMGNIQNYNLRGKAADPTTPWADMQRNLAAIEGKPVNPVAAVGAGGSVNIMDERPEVMNTPLGESLIGENQASAWASQELAKFREAQRTNPTAYRNVGSTFETLTPEEVTATGLPTGAAAQRDVRSGKINVLNKPTAATSGAISQKDATTAKLKLNTAKLARQQLNDIRAKFEPLKGKWSAGPFGAGNLPSEEGRAFDRAVDQMRSTLTALTRVPGVGAMSDYETKLDQAKFPTRNEYESVTEQQINQLESMLDQIESGYSDLLGGGSAASQASAPVSVSSPQEAMQLPPGTRFMTPDGRIKVRP